jgi:hypothetical protein
MTTEILCLHQKNCPKIVNCWVQGHLYNLMEFLSAVIPLKTLQVGPKTEKWLSPHIPAKTLSTVNFPSYIAHVEIIAKY